MKLEIFSDYFANSSPQYFQSSQIDDALQLLLTVFLKYLLDN